MLAPDLRCPRRPLDETQLLPSSQSGGYLEMLNLFRIIACLAVVGQHSFIWTNMTGNFVGTGFIAMLHLSRTAFFFLTALVVCYAQITHPRTLGGFWKRRYWEVGVPYLAWTGIYLIFSLITVSGSWDEVGRFLRHNLLLGFSQMYFVIVLFQFYLVFPLLLKLFQATRRHGLVLAISLGLATVLGLFLHYPAWFAPLSNFNRAINAVWPWSRNILVYQVFLVAGMLVALHLDEVLAFVGRHYRKIWTFTVVIGILMVFWYVFSVWSGTSIEDASDIYEPQATLWCLAAIAGIFSLCWWWQQRTLRGPDTTPKGLPSLAYLAGLSGGIFFAHTLFINPIRSVLNETGLSASLPWETTVAILFVGTVSVTGTFVALVLRTPLCWVLGGPVRSQQRAAYNSPQHVSAVGEHLWDSCHSSAGTESFGLGHGLPRGVSRRA